MVRRDRPRLREWQGTQRMGQSSAEEIDCLMPALQRHRYDNPNTS